MGNDTLIVGGDRKIMRIDVKFANVEIVVDDESMGNVFALLKLNDDTVLCGSDNGKIFLYDNIHKSICNEEQCHNDLISSLLIYKSHFIISGSGDKTIKVFNVL